MAMAHGERMDITGTGNNLAAGSGRYVHRPLVDVGRPPLARARTGCGNLVLRLELEAVGHSSSNFCLKLTINQQQYRSRPFVAL